MHVIDIIHCIHVIPQDDHLVDLVSRKQIHDLQSLIAEGANPVG